MISIMLFFLSVFCILYYGIVIAYSGLQTSFAGFWPGAAVLSAFFAVFLQSNFYQSFPSVVISIIRFLVIGIFAIFLIILLKILTTSSSGEDHADFLLVPGAIVRGEKPSNALQERINAAYKYLEANPDTVAVLSGFQNPGAKISQGKCMQKELRKKGIPAYRLLVEDHARTTEENVKFSRDYMTLTHPKVCIVSNRFHIYRILKIVKKCGYEEISGIGTKTPLPIVLHCYVREVFAVALYLIRNA